MYRITFLTVFLSTFFPVDVDVRPIDFIYFIVCIYDDSYLASHLRYIYPLFLRKNRRSIVGGKKQQAPYDSIALINFELHFFAEHCLLLSNCFYLLINALHGEWQFFLFFSRFWKSKKVPYQQHKFSFFEPLDLV